MANIYKNAFFDLANTDKTDIYTVPSDSRAIIKTIQANNHAGSNPELEAFVYDNSATTEYEISHKVIVKTLRIKFSYMKIQCIAIFCRISQSFFNAY